MNQRVALREPDGSPPARRPRSACLPARLRGFREDAALEHRGGPACRLVTAKPKCGVETLLDIDWVTTIPFEPSIEVSLPPTDSGPHLHLSRMIHPLSLTE